MIIFIFPDNYGLYEHPQYYEKLLQRQKELPEYDEHMTHLILGAGVTLVIFLILQLIIIIGNSIIRSGIQLYHALLTTIFQATQKKIRLQVLQ